MSARDVIAETLTWRKQMVTTIGMDADAILAALTDAGYLVVHIDSLVETVQDHLADATPVSIRERQEP